MLSYYIIYAKNYKILPVPEIFTYAPRFLASPSNMLEVYEAKASQFYHQSISGSRNAYSYLRCVQPASSAFRTVSSAYVLLPTQ